MASEADRIRRFAPDAFSTIAHRMHAVDRLEQEARAVLACDPLLAAGLYDMAAAAIGEMTELAETYHADHRVVNHLRAKSSAYYSLADFLRIHPPSS
jgi:hypothetical protein